MRFAAGSNTGSWIQAGKAAAQGASDLFKVARENSPDYGMLATENMKNRSKERQVANAAEAQVRQAGIKAAATVKKTEIEIDAEEKILDTKLGARRKAGIVGALGAVAGGALLGVQNKQAAKREAARDAQEQARWEQRLQYIRESNANMPTAPEVTPFQAEPFKWDGGSGTSGSSDSSIISSGQSVAAGKGKGSGGKMFTQSEIESLAVQAGFSPSNAKIMAAIGMGESGGDSSIDTVQSGLDPGKNNEYSLGLVQINAQAHGDKLSRRGWTAEDLRDPLKNLTIAKEVYDEVGSFKPWSVYTKGIYKDYL